MATTRPDGLIRALPLGQAASIVVGIVIGSGIFVGSNRVAMGVTQPWMLFAIWIGAGLATLLGAFIYAEVGAMFPASGGDYVYATKGLGRFWGFFNGWNAFAINYPASLGALGLLWAIQLDQLKPGGHSLLFGTFSLKFTAAAIIALFAIVNYLGVRQGGWAQLVVTVAKLALILGLVILGLTADEVDGGRLTASSAVTTGLLSAAIAQAFFAYDGWSGVTRVAGEVKDPQRNVPRSLVYGISTVIVVYAFLTLTYLLVLGLDGMRGTGLDDQTAKAIASRTAEVIFGNAGKVFVSVIILVSILGPINGLSLAGPRVYYAMARDGLFPRELARLHPTRNVPHVSILSQAAFSILLVLFFDVDTLIGYVVLASLTSYGITTYALIRLRRDQPRLDRPYKVPFYPVLPIAYLVLTVALIVYLFADALTDQERLLGMPRTFFFVLVNLLAMTLAVPVYRWMSTTSRAGAAD